MLVGDGFPFDVAWMDIDDMQWTRDFTLNEQAFPGEHLRSWVDALHRGGRRLVVTNDPGIPATLSDDEYPPFAEGLAAQAFALAGEGESVGRNGVALVTLACLYRLFAVLSANSSTA